ARAELAQHLEAVHLRQPEIEDEEIELVRGERGVGLAAAADLVDGIAGVAERAQEAVGQHLVVFGDQDPHACLQRCGDDRRLRHPRVWLAGGCRAARWRPRVASARGLYERAASPPCFPLYKHPAIPDNR